MPFIEVAMVRIRQIRQNCAIQDLLNSNGQEKGRLTTAAPKQLSSSGEEEKARQSVPGLGASELFDLKNSQAKYIDRELTESEGACNSVQVILSLLQFGHLTTKVRCSFAAHSGQDLSYIPVWYSILETNVICNNIVLIPIKTVAS